MTTILRKLLGAYWYVALMIQIKDAKINMDITLCDITITLCNMVLFVITNIQKLDNAITETRKTIITTTKGYDYNLLRIGSNSGRLYTHIDTQYYRSRAGW